MTPPRVESDHYALACEVGGAITSSLRLEEVLENVARRVAEAMDVWEVDLYEYYPESETIVASAVWSPELSADDRAWVGTALTLSERPSYRPLFESGEFSEAYADDEQIDEADRRLMTQWGELATLAAPLLFEDTVIGCLTLIEKREMRRFSDDDKRLLALLAVPAAVAVHNARLYHGVEQEERHLGALLGASRALACTVDMGDVLALVCRSTAEALGVPECLIYEWDRRGDDLVVVAYHGPDEEYAATAIGRRFALDDTQADRAVLERGEVKLDLISDPWLDDQTRADMERYGEKCNLSVPLLHGGDVLGELVLVESAMERRFSPAEIDLARGFGERAGLALQRARLFQRQREQNQRLEALLDTSRVLAGTLDPEAVFDRVRAEVSRLFSLDDGRVEITVRAPSGVFLSLAEAAEEWQTADETTPSPSCTATPVVTAQDAVVRRALEALGPVLDGDGAEPRLVAPLVLEGAVAGLMSVRFEAGAVVDDEAVELIQVLADQAAAAAENARLYRTVQQQAITDGLTGLYNHRYFYERLPQEFARAQRYGLPLSLLMLDIDDFKRFNDRYGHPVGDRVLAEVGRVLAAQVRRNVDFAARYGGEEFTVLLPNTPRDGAQSVGHRLVKHVAAMFDRAADAPPPRSADARLVGERIRVSIAEAEVPGLQEEEDAHVTVSIGVASFPGHAGSPTELVGNADKALYLAKRLGKNRVEVYGEEGGAS